MDTGPTNENDVAVNVAVEDAVTVNVVPVNAVALVPDIVNEPPTTMLSKKYVRADALKLNARAASSVSTNSLFILTTPYRGCLNRTVTMALPVVGAVLECVY